MDENYVLMPEDFEDHNFALNNQRLFDEFIGLVVRGVSDHVAMRLVFGDSVCADQMATARIYAIKRNPYYKNNFDAKLESIPLSEMWNPRIAIHQLLRLVRDELAKDTARLNAMKELNVITGITVIDEAGNTKMGRSLDDFYSSLEKEGPNGLYPVSADATTKH